jgi:hypothetical protein
MIESVIGCSRMNTMTNAGPTERFGVQPRAMVLISAGGGENHSGAVAGHACQISQTGTSHVPIRTASDADCTQRPLPQRVIVRKSLDGARLWSAPIKLVLIETTASIHTYDLPSRRRCPKCPATTRKSKSGQASTCPPREFDFQRQ